MVDQDMVMRSGRLGEKPELTTLPNSNNQVCNCAIKVSRGYMDKDKNWVDTSFWYNLTAWNGKAKKLVETCGKGDRIQVQCTTEIDEYTDKEGVKTIREKGVIQNFMLLSPAAANMSVEQVKAVLQQVEKNPDKYK